MRRRFLASIFIIVAVLLIPTVATAASLFFSPSSGSRTVNDSFPVSLRVNTAGVAINSGQATISFPKNLLEVTNLSSTGIFTLWPVNPAYSNSAGTVTFAGGLVNPGYTGSSGTILTITFRAKATGTAQVTIGGAKVLANDGKGTNVLTSSGTASYTITEAAPTPEPQPEAGLPGAPAISSLTHPDQNSWYANAAPSLTVNRESGVTGFSTAFDDQAATVPDRTRDTSETTSSFSEVADGIWYFHARAQNDRGWGPTGHFRVQIDTTPPLPFTIILLDGKRTSVKTPRISFTTTDARSGVQRYELVIDSGTPVVVELDQTSPYALPVLAAGEHVVRVTAFDAAGNKTEAEASFTVIPGGAIPPGGTGTEETSIGEDIGRLLDRLLPVPLRNIAESIGIFISDLQSNQALIEFVKNVTEPLITVAAVITAASIAATAYSAQLYNILYLFFRFGYFWLVPISLGKKRKPWGIVFDAMTGKPVARVVVRIFSQEFDKLKETQITDSEGRFGFIIEKGRYYVTVTVPGYTFPSSILNTAAISQYDNLYRGDAFDINDENAGALALNIPIDPNRELLSPWRLRWLKIVSILGYSLEKISLPLLISGTVLSWITLILDPRISNYFILSAYAVLIVIRYFLTKNLGQSFGTVKSKPTGQPVELAVVRIFNSETSRIVATRGTNARGQFTSLLAPGTYYLTIVKPGFETFTSHPVHVTKRRGAIRFTAELEPLRQTPKPPSGTGSASVIRLESMPVTFAEVKRKEMKAQTPSPAFAVQAPRGNDLEKHSQSVPKPTKTTPSKSRPNLTSLGEDKDPTKPA